jgi:hypothetical protein
MDEVTYISIPGLFLLILRYYHHCFGCLQQQLSEFNISSLKEDFEVSLSSSILGPITDLRSMISNTGTYIFDKVDAKKTFSSISTIVESNLLPCASYSLMGFSIFCAFLVLRNVSSSYPDVPEVTEKRAIDNLDTYDFYGHGKSPATNSRSDGPPRVDVRNFVNAKVTFLTRII